MVLLDKIAVKIENGRYTPFSKFVLNKYCEYDEEIVLKDKFCSAIIGMVITIGIIWVVVIIN